MAQNPNQNPNLNPDPFAQQYGPQSFNPVTPQVSSQDPYTQDFPNQNSYAPNVDYNSVAYGPQPQFNPNNASQANFAQPSVAPQQYSPVSNTFQDTTYPAQTPSYNQTPYGDYPQDEAQPVNTFTEKKSGNKLVLIALGVVVVVLLIATGVLVFINFSKNTKTTSSSSSSVSSSTSSSSSSSSSSVVNISLTGGANTPATLARKFNATQIPSDWITKKFTKPDRDDSGNCTNKNICGEAADPDNDGLTNIEEYNFDTDPLKSDTDKDGLADGDEVYVYYSNPNLKDTDGDTYLDGSEVASCFDSNSSVATKMETTRLNQIATSVGFKPLHEPTITTLKASGAVQTDLQKGYVEAKCLPVTSSGSSTSSSAN